MTSYIELRNQIKKLQEEAELLRKRERAQIIANIKEAITAFELTAEDLGIADGASRKKKPQVKKLLVKAKLRQVKSTRDKKPHSVGLDKRTVVKPKYRDAISGLTWTGRGKQPKWLMAAIKSGRKIEDFRI